MNELGTSGDFERVSPNEAKNADEFKNALALRAAEVRNETANEPSCKDLAADLSNKYGRAELMQRHDALEKSVHTSEDLYGSAVLGNECEHMSAEEKEACLVGRESLWERKVSQVKIIEMALAKPSSIEQDVKSDDIVEDALPSEISRDSSGEIDNFGLNDDEDVEAPLIVPLSEAKTKEEVDAAIVREGDATRLETLGDESWHDMAVEAAKSETIESVQKKIEALGDQSKKAEDMQNAILCGKEYNVDSVIRAWKDDIETRTYYGMILEELRR